MKLSSKKIVLSLMILFITAVFGAILLSFGFEVGRYIAIVTVASGAIITIIATVLASIDKLDKDLTE